MCILNPPRNKRLLAVRKQNQKIMNGIWKCTNSSFRNKKYSHQKKNPVDRKNINIDSDEEELNKLKDRRKSLRMK